MADEDSPRARPPQTPPPIITQTQRREGRQWLMLLAYLLIALVVAGLVVLGGRWAYNAIRGDEPTQEVTTTGRSSQPPAAPAPATTPQPAPAPQPAPTPPNQRDQISNTGPSETIAIFVSVSVLAGVTHYLITQRRSGEISNCTN